MTVDSLCASGLTPRSSLIAVIFESLVTGFCQHPLHWHCTPVQFCQSPNPYSCCPGRMQKCTTVSFCSTCVLCCVQWLCLQLVLAHAATTWTDSNGKPLQHLLLQRKGHLTSRTFSDCLRIHPQANLVWHWFQACMRD